MPEAKHTPGPWTNRSRKDEVRQVESAEWIADVGGRNIHERIANARLIAAAPGLLAALQAMVRAFNVKSIEPIVAMATIEHARAAIRAALPDGD